MEFLTQVRPSAGSGIIPRPPAPAVIVSVVESCRWYGDSLALPYQQAMGVMKWRFVTASDSGEDNCAEQYAAASAAELVR